MRAVEWAWAQMGAVDIGVGGDTGDKDPYTHQAHAGYIGSTDNK